MIFWKSAASKSAVPINKMIQTAHFYLISKEIKGAETTTHLTANMHWKLMAAYDQVLLN